MKLSPYPMGAAPASQVRTRSLKPVSRQTVAGDESLTRALKDFQVP